MIETLNIDNGQSSYDICLGEDGLPRLAAANFREITMMRRSPSGVWESKNFFPIDLNSRYFEIDLSCRNNRLSLFYTRNSETSSSSFDAFLMHREATEPVNWNDLSFGGEVTLESATFAFNQTVANFVESEWTDCNTLAVAYANVKENSACLATRTSGVWSSRDYVDQGTGPGLVFGVDLAADPQGNIHLTRTDAVNRVFHRVWNGSSFSPEDIVTDVRTFNLDLEIDNRAVPYVFSQSTDIRKLFISTPTDTTDEDGDGVIFLLEEAFRMNPAVSDVENLPMMGFQVIGDQNYLTLSYLSQSGGSGVNPYISNDFEYYAEISDNLSSWSTMPTDLLLQDRFTIFGRGTVSTYRSAVAVAAKEFVRIRVVRR